MFILEAPYVSELMLKTLEKNQFEVLENELAKKYLSNYNLNLVNEDSATQNLGNKSDLKVYSNSENSINWVLKNFSKSDLARLINVCKNKYEFRKQLKSIYPNFFFTEIALNDLATIDISDFPNQFIIKPSIGFLSMGVHKVSSHNEWKNVVKEILSEVDMFAKNFPKDVLSSSSFIVEEIIQGEEFAIDAYFDKEGKPVVLNIFQHPFVSEDDVSDRAYVSSGKVIHENLEIFEKMLDEIGKTLNIKNFPMHIEVIKNSDGTIIPVEINPMRFAGWCTTDLAYYAYGINIYEYFNNDLKPDWDKILADKKDKIYYFAMAETPNDIDKTKICFDYDSLEKMIKKCLK